MTSIVSVLAVLQWPFSWQENGSEGGTLAVAVGQAAWWWWYMSKSDQTQNLNESLDYDVFNPKRTMLCKSHLIKVAVALCCSISSYIHNGIFTILSDPTTRSVRC